MIDNYCFSIVWLYVGVIVSFVINIDVCLVVNHIGEFLTLDNLDDFLLGIGVNATYRCYNVVTLVKVNEFDALRGTAHNADVGHMDAKGYAGLVDDDEVVVVVDALEGYEEACLIRDIHGLDALAAAVCDADVCQSLFQR